MIFQITGGVSSRFEPMGMIPAGKRSRHLAVAELSALFIIMMFGNPALGKGTNVQT
jgi:hypothetical protein